MSDFPDDILGDLIEYTQDSFREHLSYSKSDLGDCVREGHISHWDVLDQAIYTANKEGCLEIIQLCADSLGLEDKKSFIKADRSDIIHLIRENHSELLNYYLEHQYFSLTSDFIDFYQNNPIKDNKGNVVKNIATSIVDTYIFNDLLEQRVDKKEEKNIRHKI